MYDSKIYEFHENDWVGMQAFLLYKPNIQCLIKIRLNENVKTKGRGKICEKHDRYRYIHSMILLYAFKNNEYENLIFRCSVRQIILYE